MATDASARERLRAVLNKWDQREGRFATVNVGEVVEAARALLAEPPPAGDAALLLRELREWLRPAASFMLRSQQVIGKIDDLLARAAKAPAAAEPDGLAEARQAMRPLSDEQALLTLFRENKRLRAAAEPEPARDALLAMQAIRDSITDEVIPGGTGRVMSLRECVVERDRVLAIVDRVMADYRDANRAALGRSS